MVVQSNRWIESGFMTRWFLLTSGSAVAGVTEELSVPDSDLSSGLSPSPKVSPAADTLQDQQETVSLDTSRGVDTTFLTLQGLPNQAKWFIH